MPSTPTACEIRPCAGSSLRGIMYEGRSTPSLISPYSDQPLVLNTRSPAWKPSMLLSTTCATVRAWQGAPGGSTPRFFVAPLVGVERDVEGARQRLAGSRLRPWPLAQHEG